MWKSSKERADLFLLRSIFRRRGHSHTLHRNKTHTRTRNWRYICLGIGYSKTYLLPCIHLLSSHLNCMFCHCDGSIHLDILHYRVAFPTEDKTLEGMYPLICIRRFLLTKMSYPCRKCKWKYLYSYSRGLSTADTNQRLHTFSQGILSNIPLHIEAYYLSKEGKKFHLSKWDSQIGMTHRPTL